MPSLSRIPTKEELALQYEQLDQAKARLSLAAFATRLNPRLKFQPFHHYVIEHLEAVERGEIRDLIISIPPRHGKTSLVSEAFPSWILGRDPYAQIILASYGLELARKNSRAARNKFYEPSWPFPDVQVAGDSASVERWGTSQGGSVLAAGVGSAITGFGSDYLLIDDPFRGREDADSPSERDRVWEWFRNDASTRLMPRGRTIILATRWHEDDLIGRILAEPGADENWTVINLPAIATENDPIGRLPGDPLDPDRYPVHELLRLQNRIGSRAWSSLYQGSPTPEGGDLLKQEWWQYYDPSEMKTKGLKPTFMVVDPAFGAGSGNDYSAILVGGTLNGRFYLIDMWRKRVTYPELRAAIGDLYRRWQIPVVIEDIGPGKILLQEMRSGAYGREDHIAVPTIPYKLPTGTGSRGGYMLGKRQRVEMISNFVEGGLVFLPDDARWVKAFIEECVAGDTKVFTRNGLAKISSIQPGDEVLTHRGRFRRVLETSNRIVDEVYRVKAKTLDEIVITANHPLLTMTLSKDRQIRATDWVAAEKLSPRVMVTHMRCGEEVTEAASDYPHDALTLPSIHDEDTVESLDLASFICPARSRRNKQGKYGEYGVEITKQLIVSRQGTTNSVPRYLNLDYPVGRLLGLYIAEGSCTNGAITWSLGTHEHDLISEVEHLLHDRFGLRSRRSLCSNDSATRVIANAAIIKRFFAEFGTDASTKHVPDWLWNAPDEFIDGLTSGWADGDGHVGPGDLVRAITISETLAWQMKLLLARIGYSGSISQKPPGLSVIQGREHKTKTAYTVRWRRRVRAVGGAPIWGDEHVGYSVTDHQRLDGSHDVFNLHVDEDESYVTTAGTVHNCSDFPGGAHDDQVDCLCMFLSRASVVRDEIRNVFMQPTSFMWGAST